MAEETVSTAAKSSLMSQRTAKPTLIPPSLSQPLPGFSRYPHPRKRKPSDTNAGNQRSHRPALCFESRSKDDHHENSSFKVCASDCPACDPMGELARSMDKLLDGQWVRPEKKKKNETSDYLLNTVTRIKSLHILCLTRDERTAKLGDRLQAEALHQPPVGMSLIDIYFVRLYGRQHPHDSRLCLGVCDAIEHSTGVFCRFCRQRLGSIDNNVVGSHVTALKHIGDHCQAFAAGVRAALHNAFLYDANHLFVRAGLQVANKDIANARLQDPQECQGDRRSFGSIPRSVSNKGSSSTTPQAFEAPQAVDSVPQIRVRQATAAASSGMAVPRMTPTVMAAHLPSAPRAMLASSAGVTSNAIPAASIADSGPVVRTAASAGETCAPDYAFAESLQPFAGLLKTAGIKTELELHTHVPPGVAERFAAFLAKRCPGDLTAVGEFALTLAIEKHVTGFVGLAHNAGARGIGPAAEAFAQHFQPFAALLKKAGIAGAAQLRTHVPAGAAERFTAFLTKRYPGELTLAGEFALTLAIESSQADV